MCVWLEAFRSGRVPPLIRPPLAATFPRRGKVYCAPGGARKPCGLQGNGLPRPLRGLAMTDLGGAVGLDMEGIAVVVPKTFPQWGKREAPLDMIPCRWQGIPQFQVARQSRVG